jgi:hypothetical protein
MGMPRCFAHANIASTWKGGKDLERYRFTAADDEILKEFIRVAANVDLDAVDHKQFAGYAKRHGVYYWVMRYRGERFKIYAGRTNSLPRRIREYANSFQSGVPNDYKLQHFQDWMRERFPDAELDLYFMETSNHGERETEILRRTRPFINKRAETDSAALLAVNREFFRAGFEKRMLQTPAVLAPKHRLKVSRSEPQGSPRGRARTRRRIAVGDELDPQRQKAREQFAALGRFRDGTNQAAILAHLQRPEGATEAEMKAACRNPNRMSSIMTDVKDVAAIVNRKLAWFAGGAERRYYLGTEPDGA